EEMTIKQKVFANTGTICKADAVLATNASPLDVNAIAGATARPESVVGMHFFSPANVMRLLEVVRGAKTSKAAIATAMAVGRRIGKVPVLVGVCDGFVGNRMLHARRKQAERVILEEKLAIRASDIDVIWVYGYGWPVYRGGPMFWANQVGLKTLKNRMLEFERQYGAVWQPAPLLVRLADAGKGFMDQ